MATPTRLRRIVAPVMIVAVAAFLGFLLWRQLRPAETSAELFTGYVTSSDIYMAAPVAGTVQALEVRRGQRVEKGSALFRIDPTAQNARTEQAGAQVKVNEAQAAAQGADIERATAALGQAQVEVDRTAADLKRYLAAGDGDGAAVALQQVDQARAAAQAALRARDAAQAQLAAARAQAQAASDQVSASRAGLAVARQQLAELSAVSPTTGYVEDVLYQAGEWAAPNAPVVSIVPDDQIRLRFYVPQGRIAAYRPGVEVPVACDGCAAGLKARIDYVAPRPEFTPPVIYSLATRDKLVFMVEAVPSTPETLVVGQPISVTAIDHPVAAK